MSRIGPAFRVLGPWRVDGRELVAAELGRHQVVLLAVCAVLAPGFAVFGAAMVGAPLWWVLFPIAGATFACVVTWWAVRHEGFPRTLPAPIAAMGAGGLAWGSLAWFPDGTDGAATAALYLSVLLCGSAFFAAPLRALSTAYSLGLVASALPPLVAGGAIAATLVMLFCAVGGAVFLLHLNGALVVAKVAARQNEALAERLAVEATTDPLTGLANRRLLAQRLDAALECARRSSLGVGLLLLDLDRFKNVNDSLGHVVGDALLVEVARRLHHHLRPGDLLARLGGDEFAVLLRDVADGDQVTGVAHRLLGIASEPVAIGGRKIHVSVSIGLVHDGTGEVGSEELLRAADIALYRAKDAGRNRVAVFDGASRERLVRRVDDETELRRAIEARQIVPWLQPEVDLVTGRIVGAESLARWVRPDGSVVPAGRFMPLADELGLAEPLNEHLARETIRIRARWQRDAVVDAGFRVRLNALPSTLASAELANRFLDAVAREGCDPGGLGLEIVETGVIPNITLASENLRRIRSAGLTIALDDVGTGYSSLSLVQMLPIDVLKIDRSFVRDLRSDPRDRALVAALLSMAKALGLEVTAEGVEDVEQVVVLLDLGCRHAQGFLWSPAVPPERFEEMMLAQRASTEPRADDPLVA